jgi:hypothetical protein
LTGKLFNSKLTPTFVHATFYRMTTGKLFGFTNRTAKYYIEKRLNTPFEPWTGKDNAPIYARFCHGIRGWPSKKPKEEDETGDDSTQKDSEASEAEIARELAELAKVDVKVAEEEEPQR